MSNFDSDLFNCDPTLFAAKNSPNSAKSNHIFPGNGRVDRALILTKLDSPMAEVFFGEVIVLFDLGHLQEETGCLSCTKVQTLVPSQKNSNPSKNFETTFLSARVLPLKKISVKLVHVWGVRAQKYSKKEHFIDAESVRKNLSFFD